MITVLVESLPSHGEEGGREVRIEGDAYRHLCRARRVEIGETVRLTDGRGRALWSEVVAIDRRAAHLRCGSEAPSREAARSIELWVGTLRTSRASWLVEKATELGVAAIRFFVSEHSTRTYTPNIVSRLDRVAVAALQQCHGSQLPSIEGEHTWRDLLALEPAAFLDPEAADGDVTPFTASSRRLVILVGPEGGWSPAERQQLAAAGHTAIRLGERVLRVETAALAGVSLALFGASDGGVGPSEC